MVAVGPGLVFGPPRPPLCAGPPMGRPPPPPKLPAAGRPAGPAPRCPPPPKPGPPACGNPGGTAVLVLKMGTVFEMLRLLSNNPGPSAELRASPSGRALVTPTLKLSKPVVMLYGLPLYTRN